MDERMKNALGALQAPEEVKERALQGISRKLYRRRPPVWRMAAAACALLVFLLVAGGWVYLTPTAYLSVDVNPSLELGINRFGRVVTADAYNEDGEALLEELQVRFASWEEALEEILQPGRGTGSPVGVVPDGGGKGSVSVQPNSPAGRGPNVRLRQCAVSERHPGRTGRSPPSGNVLGKIPGL